MKKPLVQELYKDFTPRVNVRETVETLLSFVPPGDLAHLDVIVLTNTDSLSRKRARHRMSSRSHISQVLGRYRQAWKGQPAQIELFVDNILKGWPRFYTWLSFGRASMVAKTLYHEIGHHVQFVSNRKLVSKEAFANDYRDKLTKQFFRQRYFQYRPLRLLARVINWLSKKTGLLKFIEKRSRI